jgi:hypothetical protein
MSKRRLGFLAPLSAVAGLPTILGASFYYLGYAGGLEIGVLDAIAFASVLYAFVKVFRDRGVSSWILIGPRLRLGHLNGTPDQLRPGEQLNLSWSSGKAS